MKSIKFQLLIFVVLALLLFIKCIDDATIGYIGIIEDEPPSLKIIHPNELDTLSENFYLELEYSDFFGIKSIVVVINSIEYSFLPETPFKKLININQLNSGLNTISVRVGDNFGNYSKILNRTVYVNKSLEIGNPVPPLIRYFDDDTIKINIANLFKDDIFPPTQIIKSAFEILPQGSVSAEIVDNRFLILTPSLNPTDSMSSVIKIKGSIDSREGLASIYLKVLHSYYIPSLTLYNCLDFKLRNQYVYNVNVYSLYLNNKGITNTEGIEHFAELNYLSLSDNNFRSLDISNLHKLSSLSIVNGILDTLTMAEDLGLQYINITNTKLKHINLWTYKYLRNIHLNNNLLETLILPEELYFSCYITAFGNNLKTLNFNLISQDITNLDLTNNVLEEIFLGNARLHHWVYLENNKLRWFEVKRNNSRQVEKFYINNNELDSLDISGLGWFYISIQSQTNPGLYKIFVTQNQKDAINSGDLPFQKDPWSQLIVKP